MKTPSKELCVLVARELETLTIEEKACVVSFAIGYGLQTPFAISAQAALIYLKLTNQRKHKTTVEMPPVRSAEDEAATVNSTDGHTYECLCIDCAKQFALPHKNAPHHCGCNENAEAKDCTDCGRLTTHSSGTCLPCLTKRAMKEAR